MKKCMTCDLIAKRDDGTAPLWDNMYRTNHWDVVHSYNTSLAGWLVLVSREHLSALDEMSDEQAIELGLLIRRVSIILKEITGCVKTYVVQFAENQDHQHVHVHIVPRMDDMTREQVGIHVFQHLGVAEKDRITEDEMNRIGARVRERLYDFAENT